MTCTPTAHWPPRCDAGVKTVWAYLLGGHAAFLLHAVVCVLAKRNTSMDLRTPLQIPYPPQMNTTSCDSGECFKLYSAGNNTANSTRGPGHHNTTGGERKLHFLKDGAYNPDTGVKVRAGAWAHGTRGIRHGGSSKKKSLMQEEGDGWHSFVLAHHSMPPPIVTERPPCYAVCALRAVSTVVGLPYHLLCASGAQRL